MSSKNFNLFEQHVEKLALVLGLAGAGYLIWLSFQAYTIPGTTQELENAENKVSDAVRDLETARKNTIALGRIAVNVGETFRGVPVSLPSHFLATDVPHFVPYQPSLTAGVDIVIHRRGEGLVITPSVPGPQNNVAMSWRGIVFDGPPGVAPGNNPAQAAAPPPAAGRGAPVAPGVPTKDKNLIVISGYLPIDAFVRSMEDPADVAQRLPGDQQISAIYRVEAQRRQRIGYNWSSWTNVAIPADLPVFPINPTKVDRSQIDSVISQLKEKDIAGKILQPASYYTPPPESQSVLLKMLPDSIKAMVPGVGGGGVRNAPAPTPDPAAAHAAAAAAAVAAAATTTAPAGPVLAPTDPVYWIVDEIAGDNIPPDAEYQYQVRLVMYNPTFNYMYDSKPGKLDNESMRGEVTIASPWVEITSAADNRPTIVQIPGNMYFYVTNYSAPMPRSSAPNTPRVTTPIYKWTEGRWFADHYRTTDLGTAITGSIMLPNRKTQPVPTNHVVVDIISSEGIGNEVEAVLLDPEGNLVVRRRTADLENKRRKELDDEVKRIEKELRPVVPNPKGKGATKGGSGQPNPASPPGSGGPGGGGPGDQ
ncbi:MAG: hypothetical protein FWD61_07860 [Phycisphaerales bacterium]|nr:hypothetical protein [Phycisphaerales bacterium]